MFADKVRRTIDQIQVEDHATMAAQITANRMAWLDRMLPTLKPAATFTPRDVFELLFFEQMGLAREDLPVVIESDREIVWRSINPCTLLAACEELGLDTRRVCRSVNEKATQAFVSRINPELRFHRSYRVIRPYAGHCEERILRVDFAANMERAIEEARRARAAGLPPRGAVVTFADRTLGFGRDKGDRGPEAGLHAVEMALQRAVENFGEPDLCGGILFSTCEPCLRCTTLAIQANLTTLVYGTPRDSPADWGRPDSRVTSLQLIEESAVVMEVITGVLAKACRELVQ